jgi:hypothetical protein
MDKILNNQIAGILQSDIPSEVSSEH